MKQRLGIALAFVALLSAAACSGGGGGGGRSTPGGGGGSTPTPVPAATATPPNATPTPVRTVVTTSFTTAGQTVQLPVSNGFSCVLTIPSNDVVPPANFIVAMPAEGATVLSYDPAATPPPYSVIQTAVIDWKTNKEVTFSSIPSVTCSDAMHSTLPPNAIKYVTPTDPNSLLPPTYLIKHADGTYGIQEPTNALANSSTIPLGVL